MRFIEEVVVDEFLPTLRSMLAESLRERGLTQSEVADVLGISQSAVSKYAHGEVTRREAIVADERVTELVDELAAGLATGEMSRVQALVEAEVLVRRLEQSGDLLAELHEASMPELAAYDGEFAIHDPDSQVRQTERVLASVRRGLRVLENASGFAAVIPNVGSNCCECLPDATDIEDVAGVPGRIFDVKGRATVPGEPEFGVSGHVARVLLAARANGVEARGAINVKYTGDRVAALEDDGHVAAEFDAEAELEPAIAAALEASPDATVLYQTGGFGIEPIVYVLGADAPDAADAVRDLR